MALFAIGDLHLSFASNKPMDIFGKNWENHPEWLAQNWKESVKEEDTVLVPGDISWAINYNEVEPDLHFIDTLPGRKIILKGNHDYWWTTIKKVREHLPDSIKAIQNDSITLNEFVVAGARGWNVPTARGFTVEDEKIYTRELGRLQLSLEHAKRTGLPIICMLHYPPTDETYTRTGVIDLLEEYKVVHCVYGHIHGSSISHAMPANFYRVPCELVSADAISFTPKRIL